MIGNPSEPMAIDEYWPTSFWDESSGMVPALPALQAALPHFTKCSAPPLIVP